MSSTLICSRFGRLIVFSIVLAISTRRQREKLVADDGHRLGDVALVTTVISTISTPDSDSFSPESLLLLLSLTINDGDCDDDTVAGAISCFFAIATEFSVSPTDELSSVEIFGADFSLLSIF